MKPWNQAAWKQNTYSKRVTVKPVGAFPEGYTRFSSDPHCEGCGYHVCSCAPKGWRIAETAVDHALPGSDLSVAVTITQSPTGGLTVNAMTLRQRMDLDPSDEECLACDGVGDFGAACGNGGAPCEECGGLGRVPTETPSLTLAQVAKLPIGTKVVVECGDECFPTGTGLTFDGWVSASRVSFVEDVSGTRWTVTFEEAKCFTFEVVR